MSWRGRILSYLVAICLALSVPLPAYAIVYLAYTQECEILQMLKESAYAHVDEDMYWMQATERYKAVVIMAYLMGIEHEIYEMTPESPNFVDSEGEDEYTRQVMAFAKANPQLGFLGCDDNYFHPREYATLFQIYRMLALTPEDTIDVQDAWSQMFAEAALAGYKEIQPITNDQLATAIVMFREMLRASRYNVIDYTTTNTKIDCKGLRGPFHERIRTRAGSDRQKR
jgi:hypothetical protein